MENNKDYNRRSAPPVLASGNSVPASYFGTRGPKIPKLTAAKLDIMYKQAVKDNLIKKKISNHPAPNLKTARATTNRNPRPIDTGDSANSSAEKDWQFPKKPAKRKKTSITESPDISDVNNFEAISVADEMSEGETEFEPPATSPSNRKPARPPPLYLQNSNIKTIVALLTEQNIARDAFLVHQVDSTNHTITTNSKSSYDAILHILKEAKIEFFTYTPIGAKPKTLLVKGIRGDFACEDILNELRGLEIPNVQFIKVAHYCFNKIDNTKFHHLVQISSDSPTVELFKVKSLAYQRIRWEYLRKTGMFQCMNCQRLGHASHNCKLAFRCVKCASNHGPAACPLAKGAEKAALKCANCGETGHPASYKGCPYIKYALSLKKQHSSRHIGLKQQKIATIARTVNANASYAQAAQTSLTARVPEHGRDLPRPDRLQMPTASYPQQQDRPSWNAGESRIPVPRAVRPSFLPKSRFVLGSPKIGGLHGGSHRRSNILAGCRPFIEHDDTSPTTPREQFSDNCFFSSTPSGVAEGEGKLSDVTFTITPGVWSTKENADREKSLFLQRGGEENMLRRQNNSQMSIIEDVVDSCLIDVSLGPSFNDLPAPSTPHYLMLTQKQNSFEHDESLGILTPDQMTDFTVGTLGCSRTPSCENLTGGTGGSGGSRLALTRASGSRPSEGEPPTWPEVGEATESCSERTPSPDELPLDPKPIIDPIESCPSNRPVPSSFITSVTSITSLEAGYQGDGENSRPASRGPDPPAVVPPVPSNLSATCRPQDPMTDSDFFTESDADAHEEIVRGDRRAQVIDGTLFCAPGGQRCPSFTGEEMDSSGIYSDIDKRQDENTFDLVESEDRTPDTADTEVSQRSQPSPVKPEVVSNFLQASKTCILDGSGSPDCSMGVMEATVVEMNVDATRPELVKPDPTPLKKYKMPKRNVVSKIKAMIESGTKEDLEPKRATRCPKKNGRWDAVMSKIEAGKSEQRSRPLRKEVKSRILQSIGPSSSSSSSATNTSARRLVGDANNNNNRSSSSSNGSANTEKRRTRPRQGTKAATQETARSSVRSSMSDLSSGHSKDAPKRSPTTTSQPRRVQNGRGKGSRQQQIRVNNGETKKSCSDVSTLKLEKSPTPLRKSGSARRTAPVNGLHGKGPTNAPSTTAAKDRNGKESNHNLMIVPEVRHQYVQTENFFDAIRDKRTDDTVQALSITVQYLARELEGFSGSKLRKDYDSMKTKWLIARTEVKDLRTSRSNLEGQLFEEREDHDRTLSRLRSESETRHADKILLLASALEEEKLSFDRRLDEALDILKEEHKATIVRLNKEHGAEIQRHLTEVSKRRENNEEIGDNKEKRDKQDPTKNCEDCEDDEQDVSCLREQVRILERALNAKNEEYVVLQAEVKDLTIRAAEGEELGRRLESRVRDTSNESRNEKCSLFEKSKEEASAACDVDRKSAGSEKKSLVHDQGAALRAEVWSLRSVLELRSQENAALRTEIEGLRRQVEDKEALEQRVVFLEARCEDLKAQLDGKEAYERQISHDNEILLGSFHEVSKHNKRLAQRNEELQWRLRQKNEVVNVLANQLATPPQRLSRSLGPELMDNDTIETSVIDRTIDANRPDSGSMIKFVVQKSDSVSYTLDMDESSDSTTSGPPSSTTVFRQNSLRVASRKSVDLRARSKSVSISNSTRDQLWNPGYNSTPVPARRRPRSDPSTTAGDDVVAAVTADPSPGPRPQEAGGEAMISEEASATSSEDESSTSSDIPRLGMDFPWSKETE